MQGKVLLIGGKLAVLLIPLFLAASAWGDNNADTLVLKDGSRIPVVAYKVDKFYKVLRYRSATDTKDKFTSFTDIEALIGSDGVNHAPELLEGWYRPSTPPSAPKATPDTTAKNAGPSAQENKDTLAAPVPKTQPQAPAPTTWRTSGDPLYKKARMRFWNMGLRLAGNFSLPAGDWYTDVNPGVGFEGDLFIALTHDLALRFSVSRAGLNVDDDFFAATVEGATLFRQSAYLHATRYFISAVYYQRIHPLQDKSPIWHAWTGLGAISHHMGASITVRDNETGDFYTGVTSTSSTKFAVTGGGGVIAMLNKNYGIDFSAGLDIVFVPAPSDYYENSYGYIFDLKIGLITLF